MIIPIEVHHSLIRVFNGDRACDQFYTRFGTGDEPPDRVKLSSASFSVLPVMLLSLSKY